jgi:hypothetical protein
MGRLSRRFAVAALVGFLVIPSFSGSSFAAQKRGEQKKATVARAVQVVELRKIEQLKEAFQRDAGKVRFVTILSPT